MRNELDKIELIEKYLRDELSAADKKAFEDKLKTDVNLQKEVGLQRDVIRGIERVGVKQSIQIASRKYDNRRRGFFLGIVLFIAVSGAIGIRNYSTDEIIKKPIGTESVEKIKEDETERKESLVIDNEPAVEILTETQGIDVVKFPTKEFQYFTINSSIEATITGAEGTKITFKANSFNVPKNSPIKIRLKEYYKMSDIAFSNLTTETLDGKLLETGGMVYVDALAENKKVDLKRETFFDIKFPFDEKKKDMILFDGKTKNKTIVWEESEVNEIEIVEEFIAKEWEGEVFTIVEKMPEFKGGQKKMFEYLGENLKYPAAAKAKGISGKVYLNFVVGNNGEIRNVRVLRGVHPLLDAEAIRVVSAMQKWSAGMQRGKTVNVSYNLPINFILKGTQPYSSKYNSEDIKYYKDSLRNAKKADTEKNLFDDSGFAEKKNSRNESAALSDIGSYALSGSKLGWINCDRFAGRGNLNLAIRLEDKDTEIKVIFHRIKSLIAGSNNGIYSRFGRVPTGERVTVFAVKYVDKKPFICLKEITTSNKSINLEFVELTKEGLKEVAKKISNI
jgi:TonB family protein